MAFNLCPTLQYELCNKTGSHDSDLFPNNNGTLEVDIYKGVGVGHDHNNMYFWTLFNCDSTKRKAKGNEMCL